MLYVIGTPIGNLEDITLRALNVLRDVDYIFCEDTRVTKKLLERYQIKKPLVSYHQHSDQAKIRQLVDLIRDYNVALVTDAGTPGIADPGGKLIELVYQQLREVKIVPLPGPSALVTALSVSGLPSDKFIFKGFIPHKKGREKFINEVLSADQTVVFYESCHRIIRCLEQFKMQINNDNRADKDLSKTKRVIVARELTKKFESIYRGSVEEILDRLKQEFPERLPKGEFVVIVG